MPVCLQETYGHELLYHAECVKTVEVFTFRLYDEVRARVCVRARARARVYVCECVCLCVFV